MGLHFKGRLLALSTNVIPVSGKSSSLIIFFLGFYEEIFNIYSIFNILRLFHEYQFSMQVTLQKKVTKKMILKKFYEYEPYGPYAQYFIFFLTHKWAK